VAADPTIAHGHRRRQDCGTIAEGLPPTNTAVSSDSGVSGFHQAIFALEKLILARHPRDLCFSGNSISGTSNRRAEEGGRGSNGARLANRSGVGALPMP
jgi:hypothetical protein